MVIIKTFIMTHPNALASNRQVFPSRLLLLASLLWLLSSCHTVSSLYPLMDNNDTLLFRSGLLGVWEEGDTYKVLETGADSLYHIMVIAPVNSDKGTKDTSYFTGRLVQLEGYLFMDCEVDLGRVDSNALKRIGQYGRLAMTPTHFIYRVSLRNKNEVLQTWELDYNSLEGALTSLNIAYYQSPGGDFILLEPTPRLRKLMVELVKYPSAWKQSFLLRSGAPPTLAQGTAR